MKIFVMRCLFWLSWPLIFLYTPTRHSARILVVRNNEFLAVKPYFGGGWVQLPGGGIKHGELAKSAAIRELAEEVGIIKSDVTHLIPSKVYFERGLFLRYEIFVCSLDKNVPIKMNRELISYQWLPLHERASLSKHIQESLSVFDTSSLV